MDTNVVRITGEVTEKAEYSHKLYGESFYKFPVKVRRKSDAVDIIVVMVSDHLLDVSTIKVGDFLDIKGRIYGRHNDDRRLDLGVFTCSLDKLEALPEEDINEVTVSGVISRDVIYKQTSNRQIADIFIASRRNYNKSDYIPLVAWGRNAKFAKNFKVSDSVVGIGRLQGREFFRGEVFERYVYEVSLYSLEAVEESSEE